MLVVPQTTPCVVGFLLFMYINWLEKRDFRAPGAWFLAVAGGFGRRAPWLWLGASGAGRRLWLWLGRSGADAMLMATNGMWFCICAEVLSCMPS